MFTKKDVVSLIDLTSLNTDDNEKVILDLANVAVNNVGCVAAICINKELIPFAKTLNVFEDNNIKIATVVNFPKGNLPIAETLKELDIALNNGADEIDLVMPFDLIINNQTKEVEKFIAKFKKHCPKTLKVIIESGVLQKENLIREASKIAIYNGANFIKTSTGKVPINATLEAATYMMEEIQSSKTNCGFKASGGIKTLTEAFEYLNLAQKLLNVNTINKNIFRFGASSLLTNILDSKQESNSTY